MARSQTPHAQKGTGENERQRSIQRNIEGAAVRRETATRAVESIDTGTRRGEGERNTTGAEAGTEMIQAVMRAGDIAVDIGVREITMTNTAILHITLLFSQIQENALTVRKVRGQSQPVICHSMIISVRNRSLKTKHSLRT